MSNQQSDWELDESSLPLSESLSLLALSLSFERPVSLPPSAGTGEAETSLGLLISRAQARDRDAKSGRLMMDDSEERLFTIPSLLLKQEKHEATDLASPLRSQIEPASSTLIVPEAIPAELLDNVTTSFHMLLDSRLGALVMALMRNNKLGKGRARELMALLQSNDHDDASACASEQSQRTCADDKFRPMFKAVHLASAATTFLIEPIFLESLDGIAMIEDQTLSVPFHLTGVVDVHVSILDEHKVVPAAFRAGGTLKCTYGKDKDGALPSIVEVTINTETLLESMTSEARSVADYVVDTCIARVMARHAPSASASKPSSLTIDSTDGYVSDLSTTSFSASPPTHSSSVPNYTSTDDEPSDFSVDDSDSAYTMQKIQDFLSETFKAESDDSIGDTDNSSTLPSLQTIAEEMGRREKDEDETAPPSTSRGELAPQTIPKNKNDGVEEHRPGTSGGLDDHGIDADLNSLFQHIASEVDSCTDSAAAANHCSNHQGIANTALPQASNVPRSSSPNIFPPNIDGSSSLGSGYEAPPSLSVSIANDSDDTAENAQKDMISTQPTAMHVDSSYYLLNPSSDSAAAAQPTAALANSFVSVKPTSSGAEEYSVPSPALAEDPPPTDARGEELGMGYFANLAKGGKIDEPPPPPPVYTAQEPPSSDLPTDARGKELGMGYFTNLAMGGQADEPTPPEEEAVREEELGMGMFSRLGAEREGRQRNVGRAAATSNKRRRIDTAGADADAASSADSLYVDERVFSGSEFFMVTTLPPTIFVGGGFTSFAFRLCWGVVAVHTLETLLTNFGPKAWYLHLPFAFITPRQHVLIDCVLIGSVISSILLWPDEFGAHPYLKALFWAFSISTYAFVALHTSVCSKASKDAIARASKKKVS